MTAAVARLVEFVKPQPFLKEMAEDILSPLLLVNGSIPHWFKYAVEEGILDCAQINDNGVPMAIVYFHVSGSKLVVDMIQSITEVPAFGKSWYADPTYTAAFAKLAQSRNCTHLEARTSRKAVLSLLSRFGWEAESINIVKKV